MLLLPRMNTRNGKYPFSGVSSILMAETALKLPPTEPIFTLRAGQLPSLSTESTSVVSFHMGPELKCILTVVLMAALSCWRQKEIVPELSWWDRLSKVTEAGGRFCPRDEVLPTASQSAGIFGANGRETCLGESQLIWFLILPGKWWAYKSRGTDTKAVVLH